MRILEISVALLGAVGTGVMLWAAMVSLLGYARQQHSLVNHAGEAFGWIGAALAWAGFIACLFSVCWLVTHL